MNLSEAFQIKFEELNRAIHQGMARGYKQNLLLLSSYENFEFDIREYLLTVNVAQSLLEWNVGHDHKIRIEYPIQNFYDNAFVENQEQSTDIFSTITSRRQTHSPTETNHQKIDIAIVREHSNVTQDRTIIGIELKGVNKSIDDVVSDLRRMAKAMQNIDTISENSIERCYAGFIFQFNSEREIITQSTIDDNIARIRELCIYRCEGLKSEFPRLDFSFDYSTITSIPLEAIEEIHREMESDYTEVASKTGHVVSVTIAIQRLTDIILIKEALTIYSGHGVLDGYNSVHYFSENQKRGRSKFTTEQCLSAWSKNYAKIEMEIVEKIRKRLLGLQTFYLVIPPTNAERKAIYLEPLINAIKDSFPNVIYLDGCVYKKDESIASSQQARKSKQDIVDNICVNRQYIDQKKMNEKMPVVILDDVIASQTTLTTVAQLLWFLSDSFYVFALVETKSVNAAIHEYKNALMKAKGAL